MVVPSATPDLVIPERVRQILENLREALAAFDDVLGLIIYGSLARGEFRDSESNVNLLVSLNQGSAEALRALSEPFRAAWRAVRVEPFLVREAEVPRLADVFPIKLLDIQKHHVVLAGKDPFSGVRVRPEDLRYRAEQELRNHLLRLRRQIVFAGEHPQKLAQAIYRSAGALRYELGALLHLRGEPVGWRLDEVLPAAARSFGLDGDALGRLLRFRTGADDADVAGLFVALVRMVERVVEVADTMEGA